METITNLKPEVPSTELATMNIMERIQPYLGEKALKLTNKLIKNCVIQFDRGEDGKAYPIKSCGIQKHDEHPIQEYVREFRSVLSLSKMVSLSSTPNDVPEEWIRRFGLLINKLSEAEKISYGVLSPPFVIPLARIDDSYRIMFVLYTFSDFTMKELNEWLGNEAFIEEGGIANDDWSNLP